LAAAQKVRPVNISRIRQLRKLAEEHRGAWTDGQEGPVPGSIPLLKSLIESAATEDLEDIYGVLVDECVRAGRFDLELEFRRELSQRFPSDPVICCSLALCLARCGLVEQSKACVTGAVECARITNRYLRYALTTMLKMAADRGDYAAVNDAMRELLTDAASTRAEDYVFESDFLRNLDESQVDPPLLQAYRRLIDDA
jgi:hypothetical protein